MRKKDLKGSMTVEMSFLMPLIFLVLMLSIQAAFYFHDKNILNGAAYEVATVGSTRIRAEEEITEEQLNTLCDERINGKCILFGRCSVDINIKEEEVIVRLEAAKNFMKITVEKCSVVTKPEKKIRDIRRVKELGNGEKNND